MQIHCHQWFSGSSAPNSFSARASPRGPRWGAHDAPPETPYSRLGRRTPHRTHPPSTHSASLSWRLDCRSAPRLSSPQTIMSKLLLCTDAKLTACTVERRDLSLSNGMLNRIIHCAQRKMTDDLPLALTCCLL